MKKIGLLLLVILIPLLFLSKDTNSQLQPYYSGDALNFNGQVVVATANSGNLEIFKLDNNTLTRILELKNVNPIFNTIDTFSDLKLNVENGRLYVYAVSEYTLFKYDISDLSTAHLEKKAKNNYWEWYQRVDLLGDNIATFSEKGIKIYNSDLEVIDAFNFTVSNPYNISGDSNKQFLFAIDNDKIKIYDRLSRSLVREIPLNFTYSENKHRAYYDILTNEIYAVDDSYIKKFSFSGELLDSYRHLDKPGYEVNSNYDTPYIYFSNGVGIVKMAKANFKVIDYTFTGTSGGPQGWAMGLKVVNTDNGDIVVVFNGSNILLLDKNLDKVTSFNSNNYSAAAASSENLFLNLDRNWSVVDGETIVSGGGFWPNEPLKITFGSTSLIPSADNKGRFSVKIKTPNLKVGYHDIKVDGNNSNLTYSISIEVK